MSWGKAPSKSTLGSRNASFSSRKASRASLVTNTNRSTFNSSNTANKYISEQRKVKYIQDIIDGNKFCKLASDLLDIKDNNVKELYNRIKEFHRDEYFADIIQFFIKIRYKNAYQYMKILTLLTIRQSIHIDTTPYIQTLFEFCGLIEPKDEFPSQKSVNEILFGFPAGSIQEAILNDDAETFAKKIVEPGFDPMKKISVKSDSPLEFVKQVQNASKRVSGSNRSEYTCMQLIAFFGSVRCFHMAISSGNFEFFDLDYFAIAGGSKEIVSILDQKGVSFDDCFEISTKYHQHEICDWLLKMHKCEYNDEPPKLIGSNSSLLKALEYYNDAVFLFLSKNGFGNISILDACYHCDSVEAVIYLINDKGASVDAKDNDGWTPLHWASMNGHISVVRYLVEECAANIDKIALQMAGNLCSSEDKKKQVREYLEERMKKYEIENRK